MLTLKQKLAKNYINAVGWRTKKNLLLIESDDWGAIRMPSKAAYDHFVSKNIQVDKSYFDRNDSVECSSDLANLFEVLTSVKDIKNNHAAITAFTVVANPNFEQIKQNGKTSYIYEPITATYKRNSHTSGTFELFQEGIQKRIFYPQFHGREHLHTLRWIEAINSESIKEQLAFETHAFIGSKLDNDIYHYPLGYMAAFDWSNKSEIDPQKMILADGLQLFEEIFGFRSLSFLASQSIFSDGINSTLAENGVKMQIGQQFHPLGNNTTKLQNKNWGSKNKDGLIHWRRNCQFEPSRDQNYDWVNSCLSEIEIAFRWGKPAVINSHRVNYIGSIFPENRDQSLKKLKTLLTEVQKRWPNVEFIDTEKLAHIMLETIV